MENAEHILNWCENSQPHWKRLNALVPGNYTTAREHAYEAFKLASDVATLMVRCGDMSRASLESADILKAAALMIERREERACQGRERVA